MSDELTDANLVCLSQKITRIEKLRGLCVIGLKMDHDVVEQAINDHRKISEIANELIFKWLRSQDDRETAHKNLCKGLRSVNLNLCLNGLKAGQPVKASEDAELSQTESGQDVPLETTHGKIQYILAQINLNLNDNRIFIFFRKKEPLMI